MAVKEPLKATARLILRELEESDARDLYLLNSDPKVLRYTGDRPFLNQAAAAAFIRDYQHYSQNGFGRWAVTLADSGRFAGICGLNRDPLSNEVDLAFRIFPRYWARGIATEAAAAALALGFKKFELDTIISRAMRENLPSISILQKLGMRFREVSEDQDVFWLVYTISRSQYLRSVSGK